MTKDTLAEFPCQGVTFLCFQLPEPSVTPEQQADADAHQPKEGKQEQAEPAPEKGFQNTSCTSTI